MKSRVTPKLAEKIAASEPAEWLNVIVELDGGDDNVSDIATAKQEFHDVADPIIAAINALGNDVVNRAWINHTLRVRILAGDVKLIADLDGVVAVDVAQMIGADAVYEPGEQLLGDTRYMDPRSAVDAANMVRSWRRMPREEFENLARNL
jgi:hypothetical protein